MGDWHNNKIHIYSVAMHVGMVDMHTLLPWPYHMLFDRYYDHATSQGFYMYQIGDYIFHQTFCFVNFGFGILVSLNKDPSMIINTNACFCQKCNTHNHT